MEKDTNLMRSKFIGITFFATVMAIGLLLRFPLYGLLVDILITANIVMAIFFFIFTIFKRKIKNLTIFIYSLTLTIIYGFIVSIAVPKSVMDMKENYDGRIVKWLSSFFEGMEIKQVIITIVCIVSIVIIHEYFVNKSTDGVIKTSEDYLQVHYRDDFLYFMDGVFKIFQLTIIVSALINFIIILVFIPMEPLINEKLVEENYLIIYNSYKYYLPIVIGNSIVCLIPYFLLSSTVRRVVIRYVEKKEKSCKKDDNDEHPLWNISGQ